MESRQVAILESSKTVQDDNKIQQLSKMGFGWMDNDSSK